MLPSTSTARLLCNAAMDEISPKQPVVRARPYEAVRIWIRGALVSSLSGCRCVADLRCVATTQAPESTLQSEAGCRITTRMALGR
jgi:hypothetical protein